MNISVFQANRSKLSLNLLMHQTKEVGAGLVLVSKPNYIPNTGN